ncbi:uracil-DNA glycosylase [Chitinibacteraceae bacterium HSL-7]
MQLPERWRQADLAAPLNEIAEGIAADESTGVAVFPPAGQRFAALEAVAPDEVRVVILGQDPYHGAGQAHGLSFSVPAGVAQPPSLRNIWKEIARDLGISPPQHGSLTGWARQGVLLLNSVLTVRADCAGSHAALGWERVTDRLIRRIADEQQHVVFMLWGAYARKKAALIDPACHCVLESAHPSPLSAHRGFIGNGHFSAANRYLESVGRQSIDWETCL